ncbi:hypothetical protein B0J14DRAFT_670573, partial [Halenospora varia]
QPLNCCFKDSTSLFLVSSFFSSCLNASSIPEILIVALDIFVAKPTSMFETLSCSLLYRSVIKGKVAIFSRRAACSFRSWIIHSLFSASTRDAGSMGCCMGAIVRSLCKEMSLLAKKDERGSSRASTVVVRSGGRKSREKEKERERALAYGFYSCDLDIIEGRSDDF